MNINLHIEQLILDGINIPVGQHHLLQSTVATELTRMLTCGGLSSNLTHGTALSQMSTSGIQLAGNNPTQIGRQIAHSLYGRISHE